MALGFRGEIGNEKGDDDRANHGRQDDQRSPSARRGEDVGIIGDRERAVEEQVMQNPYQVAKNDRAQSGDDAETQRQEREREQAEATALLVAGHVGS